MRGPPSLPACMGMPSVESAGREIAPGCSSGPSRRAMTFWRRLDPLDRRGPHCFLLGPSSKCTTRSRKGSDGRKLARLAPHAARPHRSRAGSRSGCLGAHCGRSRPHRQQALRGPRCSRGGDQDRSVRSDARGSRSSVSRPRRREGETFIPRCSRLPNPLRRLPRRAARDQGSA